MTDIRSKILKESPRKSSVSYCSTEFSTKSYLESTPVCDIEPMVASVQGSPYRVMKYKSCTSEAHATINTGLVANGSFGNDVDDTGAGVRAMVTTNTNGQHVLERNDNCCQSERKTLSSVKKKLDEQSDKDRLKHFPVKTFNVYDDTVVIESSANSKLVDYQQKSVDDDDDVSVGKVGDVELANHNYLDDVEQVVRQLSDKLSQELLSQQRPRSDWPSGSRDSSQQGRHQQATKYRSSQCSSVMNNLNLSMASLVSIGSESTMTPRNVPANRSLPASPISGDNRKRNQQKSNRKNFFNSPSVIRKMRRKLVNRLAAEEMRKRISLIKQLFWFFYFVDSAIWTVVLKMITLVMKTMLVIVPDTFSSRRKRISTDLVNQYRARAAVNDSQ